jgi:hypothetical protein
VSSDLDIARFRARVAAGALLEIAARGVRESQRELSEAEGALREAADVYEGARETFGEWIDRARTAAALVSEASEKCSAERARAVSEDMVGEVAWSL